MSNDVQEIERAIQTLPRSEVERLREWIESFLEAQLEITDDFAASIDRGKKDIAEGHVRVRESDETSAARPRSTRANSIRLSSFIASAARAD